MKINFNSGNGILNVALDGRLDTVTAPELEKFLDETHDGKSLIVMDCKKLLYISSAGLRVLLSTQKKTKGALKLVSVCEDVMEVLEMTGFADILVIE